MKSVLTSAPTRAASYRRIVLFLIALVIVPSVLLSAMGLMLLALGEAKFNILIGILILCFTGAVITGVVLVWVFVHRDAKLSELQADFVSKVSHELRTPLTSIRMFTDTLALRRGNPEVEARCIEALTKEGKRLQELIDRLLDWGRMESGRRLYEMKPVDIPALIEDAIATLAPIRERRDVDLVVDVVSMPPLMCDRGAIKDALVNLLSNAYKYGGTPAFIHISARVEGDEVRISVRDNGSGIERAEHKRVFMKFYRIDDRLSREKEGSGLGLAIVHHVVRAHGGKVELDSERGQGSTFSLLLPVRPLVLEQPSEPSPTALVP